MLARSPKCKAVMVTDTTLARASLSLLYAFLNGSTSTYLKVSGLISYVWYWQVYTVYARCRGKAPHTTDNSNLQSLHNCK